MATYRDDETGGKWEAQLTGEAVPEMFDPDRDPAPEATIVVTAPNGSRADVPVATRPEMMRMLTLWAALAGPYKQGDSFHQRMKRGERVGMALLDAVLGGEANSG